MVWIWGGSGCMPSSAEAQASIAEMSARAGWGRPRKRVKT